MFHFLQNIERILQVTNIQIKNLKKWKNDSLFEIYARLYSLRLRRSPLSIKDEELKRVCNSRILRWHFQVFAPVVAQSSYENLKSAFQKGENRSTRLSWN